MRALAPFPLFIAVITLTALVMVVAVAVIVTDGLHWRLWRAWNRKALDSWMQLLITGGERRLSEMPRYRGRQIPLEMLRFRGLIEHGTEDDPLVVASGWAHTVYPQFSGRGVIAGNPG